MPEDFEERVVHPALDLLDRAEETEEEARARLLGRGEWRRRRTPAATNAESPHT